jgi:hypothetical protein
LRRFHYCHFICSKACNKPTPLRGKWLSSDSWTKRKVGVPNLK